MCCYLTQPLYCMINNVLYIFCIIITIYDYWLVWTISACISSSLTADFWVSFSGHCSQSLKKRLVTPGLVLISRRQTEATSSCTEQIKPGTKSDTGMALSICTISKIKVQTQQTNNKTIWVRQRAGCSASERHWHLPSGIKPVDYPARGNWINQSACFQLRHAQRVDNRCTGFSTSFCNQGSNF